MSSIAITFGVLLVGLGGALFGLSELPAGEKLTTLIPAGFGVALIACGIIARNDKARKHAMHLAAMIGLIGCVMPLVMVIIGQVKGKEFKLLAGGGQLVMSLLCGIFVFLCVKSFIDVRKARQAREQAGA